MADINTGCTEAAVAPSADAVDKHALTVAMTRSSETNAGASAASIGPTSEGKHIGEPKGAKS